jgi:Phage head-tail joining protein
VPEDERVRIGRLRWPVLVANRDQTPEATGTGILESFAGMTQVRADVVPVGAMTFWGTMQTDSPGITHRIFLRWFDAIDNECVIFRTTRRNDGSVRYERFRIRRWKELGGRKRFVCVECELEKTGTAGEPDAP